MGDLCEGCACGHNPPDHRTHERCVVRRAPLPTESSAKTRLLPEPGVGAEHRHMQRYP
jgi:hypothetical protein